jgi:predicted Zn-dependent protease
MTVTVDRLRAALRGALGIAGEWVIREDRRVTLARELGSSDATGERIDHHFEVAVFRDSEQTRGEASFRLGPSDTSLIDAAIAAATRRARANSGPLWSLPRPAAPARVELADPRLITDPDGAIAELGGILGGAARRARIPRARIETSTCDARVVTSNELDVEHRATELSIDCVVVTGGRRLRLAAPVAVRARRVADVDLAAEIERAIADLTAEASADPVPPGIYDLVVDVAGLERRAGGGFGWLGPLVAQASGQLARRALSRYQPGQTIYGESEPTGDLLTLSSDGAIPFGWRSAPFAGRGEAVRRFALIERGVSAGLALDAREAALRDRLPNGGARNLVLAPGERDLAGLATGARPALIANALAWLETRDSTGDVAAELSIATPNDRRDRRYRGGQIAGNLFDWLPRLRLGKDELTTATYRGPRWIGIPAIDVR